MTRPLAQPVFVATLSERAADLRAWLGAAA